MANESGSLVNGFEDCGCNKNVKFGGKCDSSTYNHNGPVTKPLQTWPDGPQRGDGTSIIIITIIISFIGMIGLLSFVGYTQFK